MALESTKDGKPAANVSTKVDPAPHRELPLPTKFQFIDAGNDVQANNTQVRRHVMQEFMRQKRWKARRQLERPGEHPSSSTKNTPDQRGRPPGRKPSQTSNPDPHNVGADAEPKVKAGVREVDQDDKIEEIPRPSLSPIREHGPASFMTRVYLSQPEPYEVESDTISDDISIGGSTYDTPSDRSSSFDLQISRPHVRPISTSLSALASGPPNPKTMLSAARVDPFDTLPMQLNREDHGLVDFYMNVMPACSYGFQTRSENAINWYKEVFIKEAMRGAVTFQNTVLVHAANTQAWVQGKAETRASIVHRARGISMLQKHLQDHPGDNSDVAISATLSATAVEDFDPRYERKSISWIHMRAAMQMIRDRGGPSAFNFQSNRRLGMLINWQDYILAGYHTDGPSFSYDHEASHFLRGYDSHLVGAQEVREQCEIFIEFLRNIEHLALVKIAASGWEHAPMRYSAFKAGSPLHRLLSSPPGMRYSGTGDRKQMISRLAALLNLNAALWEYRHSIDLSECYLKALTLEVLANELDVHLSVEALVQMLLAGSKDPTIDRPDRPWFVGRMIKVAKRLCLQSWKKLNDLLLRCLMLGEEMEPVMFTWEEELRQEVLDAPLTSFIMPALVG